MSWLSDAIGGFTGKSQAKAVTQAADKASQTQLDMFNKAVELNEPFRQAGINALSAQGGLLGIPMVAGGSSTGMPSAATGGTWAGYGQANPDVLNAWNNPLVQRQFGGDQNKYLEWHYNTMGRNEGRQLQPTGMGGTMQQGGAQGATAAADPYQTFLDSGFGRSNLETTNADFDQMVGAFGAAGNALSGSAIGALNDRNRRNTAGAFNNYYNALSGISGTGANITSQQGNQAIATGNNIANNQMAAGEARASAYTSGANALGKVFSGIGEYGTSKGWF